MEIGRDEQEKLDAFWGTYDANRAKIDARLDEVARKIDAFKPILGSLTDAQRQEMNERSRALQRGAIVDGAWADYLSDLSEQGANYARLGVRFSAWYRLIRAMRASLLELLVEKHAADAQAMVKAVEGMDLFVDIAMGEIGEAYVRAKQEIIQKQQEAIREVSTPVLQIESGLLILPVIGIVDTHRARHLTESLLIGIRDRRARVVVMDITGVPVVDSRVANHFLQTVDAARLMGADVVMTGISPEIAQTLVKIGADLGRVRTFGDLQGGIRAAKRLLAESA